MKSHFATTLYFSSRNILTFLLCDEIFLSFAINSENCSNMSSTLANSLNLASDHTHNHSHLQVFLLVLNFLWWLIVLPHSTWHDTLRPVLMTKVQVGLCVDNSCLNPLVELIVCLKTPYQHSLWYWSSPCAIKRELIINQLASKFVLMKERFFFIFVVQFFSFLIFFSLLLLFVLFLFFIFVVEFFYCLFIYCLFFRSFLFFYSYVYFFLLFKKLILCWRLLSRRSFLSE